jgi:hypothetical protein
VTALVKSISEFRGALGVGVEVVTDSTILVEFHDDSDGLIGDVGVLHYYGIRGAKIVFDAVVSGLFGVFIPMSPEVALNRAEKTKFEKYYSEGG